MISNIHYKIEYWVIIYESHDSDLAILLSSLQTQVMTQDYLENVLYFQRNNIIRNSNKIYICDNMNVYHLSSQREKKIKLYSIHALIRKETTT